MNFWFTEDEVKKVFQAPYGFKKSMKELRMEITDMEENFPFKNQPTASRSLRMTDTGFAPNLEIRFEYDPLVSTHFFFNLLF